jgi:hypothetical protein
MTYDGIITVINGTINVNNINLAIVDSMLFPSDLKLINYLAAGTFISGLGNIWL